MTQKKSLHKKKRRIASINSTKKITKAMELVSTVKLKKFRRLMENNERYSEEIARLIQSLFVRLKVRNCLHKRTKSGERSLHHYPFELRIVCWI